MLFDRVTHITIHVAKSLEYYITVNGERTVKTPTSSYRSHYDGFLLNIDELLPIVSPSHPCDIAVTITRARTYPPTLGIAERVGICPDQSGLTFWTRHRELLVDIATAFAILCTECIRPICSLSQVREINIDRSFREEPIAIQAIISAQSAVRLSIETLPTTATTATLDPRVQCDAPFRAIHVTGYPTTATSQLAFLSAISKTTTHLSISMAATCLSAPFVFSSVQHLAISIEIDLTMPTHEEIAEILSVKFPSLTAVSVFIFNAPSYSAQRLATCLSKVYPRAYINSSKRDYTLHSMEYMMEEAGHTEYMDTFENNYIVSAAGRPFPTTPFSPATAVLQSHFDSAMHCSTSCDNPACLRVLGVRLAAFSLAVARVAPLIDPLVVLPIFSHLNTRRDKFKSLAYIAF